jgi:hypothetical protein
LTPGGDDHIADLADRVRALEAAAFEVPQASHETSETRDTILCEEQ